MNNVLRRLGFVYFVSYLDSPYVFKLPRFANLLNVLENVKNMFDAFGLFSLARACNVSVAASGVFLLRKFYIF